MYGCPLSILTLDLMPLTPPGAENVHLPQVLGYRESWQCTAKVPDSPPNKAAAELTDYHNLDKA